MIILGVLLLISFGVVAVTIVTRIAKMGKDEAKEIEVVEEVVVTPGFGEKTIRVPKGARIGAVSADGKTLFVVIEGPEGQEVRVIDPWSGRERGRIKLVPDTE